MLPYCRELNLVRRWMLKEDGRKWGLACLAVWLYFGSFALFGLVIIHKYFLSLCAEAKCYCFGFHLRFYCLIASKKMAAPGHVILNCFASSFTSSSISLSSCSFRLLCCGIQTNYGFYITFVAAINILKFSWLEIKCLRKSSWSGHKKIDIKLQYNHANLRAGSQKNKKAAFKGIN